MFQTRYRDNDLHYAYLPLLFKPGLNMSPSPLGAFNDLTHKTFTGDAGEFIVSSPQAGK